MAAPGAAKNTDAAAQHSTVVDGNDLGFGTLSVKHRPVPGPVTPLAPPIFLTSTYQLESAAHGAVLCDRGQVEPGQSPWLYSRWGNPTSQMANDVMKDLEQARSGVYVLSSGMAAIQTMFLALLKTGDHVVAPRAVYGGTHEILSNILTEFGITCTFVDGCDIAAYKNAITPATKILYAETPANPTMSITDIAALAKVATEANCVLAVDSTFAGPYLQQPLRIGAHIVVHSATKSLAGHTVVTAGVIACDRDTESKRISAFLKLAGNTLDPFSSFMLMIGLKTLHVRVERQCQNAAAIAAFLEKHPAVERVYYPGLASHPQHELAKKQMPRGFGGMIAFEVRGGIAAGKAVIESVRVITLAVSLGGVESLVEHAASMTHTMVSPADRKAAGISDGLIRLSVGIEDKADLIRDLDQALSKASSSV